LIPVRRQADRDAARLRSIEPQRRGYGRAVSLADPQFDATAVAVRGALGEGL